MVPMPTQRSAPEVDAGPAHVDAWMGYDFDAAGTGPTPDVKFTITTTQPLAQTF
jgi:hypothetical protein